MDAVMFIIIYLSKKTFISVVTGASSVYKELV